MHIKKLFWIISVAILMLTACSSNDDDENKVENLTAEQLVGLWLTEYADKIINILDGKIESIEIQEHSKEGKFLDEDTKDNAKTDVQESAADVGDTTSPKDTQTDDITESLQETVTEVMSENTQAETSEAKKESQDYFEKINMDPAAKKLDEAAQKILDDLKSDK